MLVVEKMTDKVARHKQLCDELNALYERKNHDYGDSFHQTYVEEGLAMARIRLGDKFSRFKNLSRLAIAGPDQQKVTDESIRDTLIDLANYALMTVLEMDISKPLEISEESYATVTTTDDSSLLEVLMNQCGWKVDPGYLSEESHADQESGQ